LTIYAKHITTSNNCVTRFNLTSTMNTQCDFGNLTFTKTNDLFGCFSLTLVFHSDFLACRTWSVIHCGDISGVWCFRGHRHNKILNPPF
jgi:hypothetical protein